MADSIGFAIEKGGLEMTGFTRANAVENWFDTDRYQLQRVHIYRPYEELHTNLPPDVTGVIEKKGGWC
jgi:hypothetical protein